MSAEILQLNTAQDSSAEAQKGLVAEIRALLGNHLSQLLGNMFDGADDTLFRLAENADTNDQQTEYFDTMRLIRMERGNITQAFSSTLKTLLTPAAEKKSGDISLDDDELSLVDQDTMEEMVAISAMHSRAMNAFGESVNHLEARFEVLALKHPRLFAKDALTPRHICEAFQQALGDIEIATHHKLIIFKLFEKEVCLKLDVVYDQLNRMLIEEGILPQIRIQHPTRRSTDNPARRSTDKSPASQPQAPDYAQGTRSQTSVSQGRGIQLTGRHDSTGQGTATGTGGTGISNGGGSASGYGNASGSTPGSVEGDAYQSEIQHFINNFINGGQTAAGPGIPTSFSVVSNDSSSGRKYYDRRDVVRALSNLQTSFVQDEDTAFIDAESFKRALLADMGLRSGGTITRQVSQIDEKMIDFVEMLFEVIVEDKSINDIVTNQLLRLQIPVIKVAMLDETFLTSSEHAARRTLNLIAQLGMGVNDKQDTVYLTIVDIVDEILQEFDVDLSLFPQAVSRLEQLAAEQQALLEENEKQTQKEVLQAHARQVVLEEMQHHVAHKVVPEAAQPLILRHWSTEMFHRYIRNGKDSEAWREAVQLLRNIIQTLQPINSHESLTTVKLTLPVLTTTIRNILDESKQDKEKTHSAIDAWNHYIQANIDATAFDTETTSENVIEAAHAPAELPVVDLTEEVSEPSPLEQRSEEARGKLAMLPSDVKPGMWFQLYTGEESAVRRLKLSVIIMEEARLIFVDRHGRKVMEKTADEFARELDEGLSECIADHSVFDHALSNVINSLTAARA